MDNYDVIIVGAGNGGLATAATLTRKKLKTLIIEKYGTWWSGSQF